ncbi:MAG TPA: hypothetical protein VK205_16915 [Prolixibacteraceae bacterium]|nr:hypothetical protein [Prolixibacteraceae bacterium]
MKKTIWLAMITLGLWSCNSQPLKNEGKSNADSLRTELKDKSQLPIDLKDSSQYDKAFIQGLAGYNEPVQLIDNYLITGNDTIYFPEDIPFNKTIDFKATKDHKKYLLSVSRTSLTNLSYSFKLSDEKDKVLDSNAGNAVLGSMFFLASETDKDTQTGENYGSYEYWDKSNDCWFAVRIGHGKSPDGKQRAIVKYGCEDKNKQALKLQECPTLRGE